MFTFQEWLLANRIDFSSMFTFQEWLLTNMIMFVVFSMIVVCHAGWKWWYNNSNKLTRPAEKSLLKNHTLIDPIVAILSIHPPSIVLPAWCRVVEQTMNSNSLLLINDPVSLCLVGGLCARIDDFCSAFPAHGRSKQDRWLWFGLLGPMVLILYPIATNAFGLEELMGSERNLDILAQGILTLGAIGAVLLCISEPDRHFDSKKYKDAEQEFWDTWQIHSMEDKIYETLFACGYTYEITRDDRERCWKVSIYKVGSQQVLPKPEYTKNESGDNNPIAMRTASGFRPGNFWNQIPPNIDVATSLSHLDFWTQNGLLLGLQQIMKQKVQQTVMIVSLLYIVSVLPTALLSTNHIPSAWVAVFILVIFILVMSIFFGILLRLLVNLWAVVPHICTTSRSLMEQLSILTRDRHACTLEYKIEGCFPFQRGTIVVQSIYNECNKENGGPVKKGKRAPTNGPMNAFAI